MIDRRRMSEEFYQAVLQADIDTIKLLIKQDDFDINAVNEAGEGAIHLAAIGGNLDLVAISLSCSPDLQQKNRSGKSAQEVAVEWGYQELAQRLSVDSGLRQTVRDMDQDKRKYAKRGDFIGVKDLSDLMLAVARNSNKVASYLVQRGIKIHLKNAKEYTALIYFSDSKYFKLLKKRINKNNRTRHG